MEWLAYTVTFGKERKSKDFHFIRYNNWQTVNGLIVPSSIDWYNYENNKPTEKRNTVQFADVAIVEIGPNKSIFKMPEGANSVE